MLRLNVTNQDHSVIDTVLTLPSGSVKSKQYYAGFNQWLNETFIPGLSSGDRDVLSVRDKKYNTLTGFCLLKVGSENKICNLSPLLEGVGITQVLLESAETYFIKDYCIDVPINRDTIKLHVKLKEMGFIPISNNCSIDGSSQITYIKQKHIGWI